MYTDWCWNCTSCGDIVCRCVVGFTGGGGGVSSGTCSVSSRRGLWKWCKWTSLHTQWFTCIQSSTHASSSQMEGNVFFTCALTCYYFMKPPIGCASISFWLPLFYEDKIDRLPASPSSRHLFQMQTVMTTVGDVIAAIYPSMHWSWSQQSTIITSVRMSSFSPDSKSCGRWRPTTTLKFTSM